VARLAQALVRAGIGPGDRVAGFVPNLPETLAAMLAAASIGAVWTACSPDFGARGVVDRFGQTAPRLLAREDRGITGDAEVHVSVDQRRNENQPARIDRARAGRGRLRLRGDRFAVDAQRPWPRGRVRELAAGDPEHPQSLDHIS